MSGFVLDTGALIALDRGDKRTIALLDRAVATGIPLIIPAGVVAQAWRDGARQARLARLLHAVEVVDLTLGLAQAIGEKISVCGHADVVDVSVAVCAGRNGCTVITSDPSDIAKVDPGLPVHAL
jgi:predicted nucleic acid-binding protein